MDKSPASSPLGQAVLQCAPTLSLRDPIRIEPQLPMVMTRSTTHLLAASFPLCHTSWVSRDPPKINEAAALVIVETKAHFSQPSVSAGSTSMNSTNHR